MIRDPSRVRPGSELGSGLRQGADAEFRGSLRVSKEGQGQYFG